jgi:3-ketosteroid 9alpha-monooxygenase subunit B
MNPINKKKIRTIAGVLHRARQETRDSWTLDIAVADSDRDYKAGQFISIDPHQFVELADFIKYFEFHKGKVEPIRAYSLSSAPHEDYVSITIRPESYHASPSAYPPLLSPFLASDLFLGRPIEFEGYTGAYTMPEDSSALTHALHVVAGSGIVPSYSVIKDELLAKKSNINHTLIYVNKSYDNIIFHQELRKLEELFAERLKVYYFLTREERNQTWPANYYYGRPHAELLKQLLEHKEKSVVFACGPAVTKWQKKEAALKNEVLQPRFMEWVNETIEKIGIDKKRFKREVYG